MAETDPTAITAELLQQPGLGLDHGRRGTQNIGEEGNIDKMIFPNTVQSKQMTQFRVT